MRWNEISALTFSTAQSCGQFHPLPREEWPTTPDGELTMHTRPLDVGALLAEAD